MTKSNILIVDDALVSLKLLADILRAEGYQVRPANSGEHALASVADTAPDLILLDIRMPGMDGLEVLRRLKAQEGARDIPVIFLSAATEAEQRVEGFKLGAIDFISKPFQREELLARVHTHLELHQMRSRLEQQSSALRKANNQLQLEGAAERKKAKELLHEMALQHELLLREIRNEHNLAPTYFNLAGVIFVALDPNGRVANINKRGCELLGGELEDIIGRNWFERFLPEEVREELLAHFLDYMSGNLPFAEYFDAPVLTLSGEERLIRWHSTLLRDSGGDRIGALSSGEDITDRKRAEREIKALNDALEARVKERTAQLEKANAELALARDTAESAARTKSEFLANMSHEIRTPMNAILGMTDLALRIEMSAQQRDYLSKARSAADSLLGIIDDILDFSKIEAGKLHLEKRRFSLAVVLDRVTMIVGPKAQEKGLELLLNTSREVPSFLVGDSLRLQQVLINLCSNAVKFSARGEIVVSVLLLPMKDGQVILRFSVRDAGVGLTQKQMQALFQPFNQLDASTTRRYGGTGLGLVISKKLVTLMGGEIGVESQPGKGSNFYFTAVFGACSHSNRQLALLSPDLRDLRILVVDDSVIAREVMGDLLSRLGYTPAIFATADEGLAEFKRAASSRPYDLVLWDWNVPRMDGFEAALAIRNLNTPSPPPKVMLMIAYADEKTAQRAVAAKTLAGCLAKPVSVSALLDAIMAACGQARALPTRNEHLIKGSVPASLKGRRILLVEDNEFNQIVASELLSRVAGAVVTVAKNGLEAVNWVNSDTFDAVLMDIQMPLMDGYQATVRIRQTPAHAGLPIIAMTAHAMARDHDKCLAVGMNDYITKPFEPDELFTVVARWIDGRKADIKVAAQGAATNIPAVGSSLSFELGLQRCLGDAGLYDEILTRFMSTRMNGHAGIQLAFDEQDLHKVARSAHSLISSAAIIGAQALSDGARVVQVATEAGEVDRLPGLIEFVEREYRAVIAELKSYIARKSSSTVADTENQAASTSSQGF